MRLNGLTTNMIVDDVGATIDYYIERLDFEFAMGVPAGTQDAIFTKPEGQPLAFAMLTSGDVEMMFQSTEGIVEDIPAFAGAEGSTPVDAGGPTPASATRSMTLYIDVADVEELHDRLKDRVTVVKELKTAFYGALEFSIRDCNGYILTFARRPERGE